MKTTLGLQRLRVGAFLILCFLIAPISGASAVPPAESGLATIAAVDHRQAGIAQPTLKESESERPQQIALLQSAVSPEITQALQTRPASPANEQTDNRSIEGPMGLQLPEPGPTSAIIATLALAIFVMVRRVV